MDEEELMGFERVPEAEFLEAVDWDAVDSGSSVEIERLNGSLRGVTARGAVSMLDLCRVIVEDYIEDPKVLLRILDGGNRTMLKEDAWKKKHPDGEKTVMDLFLYE